jgi:hypothetical protein
MSAVRFRKWRYFPDKIRTIKKTEGIQMDRGQTIRIQNTDNRQTDEKTTDNRRTEDI